MKMTESQKVAAAAWRIRRYALQMGEVQGQGYIGQALGYADAVSYTHLDVYKRQRQYGTAGVEHSARLDGAGHQRTVRRGGEHGIVQVQMCIRDSLPPSPLQTISQSILRLFPPCLWLSLIHI